MSRVPKTTTISLRIDKPTAAEWRERAAASGLSVSDWIRGSVDEGLARSAALRLAAPEPAATDCASRPSSGATLQYCNRVVTALGLRGKFRYH